MKSIYLNWQRSLLMLLFIFFPGTLKASSNTLVIEEFLVGHDKAEQQEYVTIKNISNEKIKLDGFYLIRLSSSGSSSNLYVFSKTANFYLESKATLKIANPGYSLGAYDLRYSNSSSIISYNDTILIKDNTGKVLDLVGFGNGPEYEGSPISIIKKGITYSRKDSQDTDNNEDDFVSNEVIDTINLDLNLNKIIISEIFPAPPSGQKEWFEIYNPTNLKINLYGLKVCDGVGSIRCYTFAKDDFIEAQGFKSYEQATTRITLNNSGDWLELYDLDENIIFSTENYGDIETGDSFSLFGTKWDLTLTPTKNLKNIFTSIIEQEPKKKSKTSTKKVAKTSTKKTSSQSDNEIFEEEPSEVKGASEEKSIDSKSNINKNLITSKQLGYFVIILAICIFCGYILWEKREKLLEIYHKLKH